MDNVLVDFQSGIERLSPELAARYRKHPYNAPGIYALMQPIDGAVEAFVRLSARFDTYILSTAPWDNPTAWSDKLQWVKAHLGEAGKKRLILTHHKNLARGDFLVDDRLTRGADKFSGRLILFGSEPFPDWPAVEAFLAQAGE
jgi:5'(3')-deoxyribonucleotidase